MRFVVQEVRRRPQEEGVRAMVLIPVPKDDDGYLTLHELWYRDGNGSVMLIGLVKIACNDQVRGRQPLAGAEFDQLEGYRRQLYWFSLGQDVSYYENLRRLGRTTCELIMRSLCDIAFSTEAFENAVHWDVMHVSLLDSVAVRTAMDQFRRIAHGGPQLTPFRFDYALPQQDLPGAPWAAPRRISFEVVPRSTPRTNIHVLIGRNGVGKTRLLGSMARAVVNPGSSEGDDGEVRWLPWGSAPGFANVVSVSFSSFDPFKPVEPPPWPEVKYTYVGLAKDPGPSPEDESEWEDDAGDDEQAVDESNSDSRRKTYEDLTNEFLASLRDVFAIGREDRWARALDRLSTDPHLAELPLHELARDLSAGPDDQDTHELRSLFSGLSSGHKIVLLTITRLVQTVAERTLVLLDEPEAHLHPPLLAAFVRALSDLMTDRNGVALVATHSPVVLQEVPRSCVWKLSRWDSHEPERPRIETFGENVGVLTHEIFGLEVRESGFQAELEKVVAESATYEAVLARFNGQLGGEAKGLVRILLAHREAADR